MIKAAINRIIELAAPAITMVDERPYSTAGMVRIPDPAPDTLKLSTLTGLADYLNSDVEWSEGQYENLFITVDDPIRVSLHDAVSGVFKQRDMITHVQAVLPDRNEQAWKDVETFIIQAQVLYEMTPELEAMLKIVGNIKEETGITHADDGISQQVTAKTGVATVEQTALPNPVILKPYRSFLEIDQVESPFIMRMRKGAAGPEISLFCADGGKWRLEAVSRIKEWLVSHIPKTIKVFA